MMELSEKAFHHGEILTSKSHFIEESSRRRQSTIKMSIGSNRAKLIKSGRIGTWREAHTQTG